MFWHFLFKNSITFWLPCKQIGTTILCIIHISCFNIHATMYCCHLISPCFAWHVKWSHPIEQIFNIFLGNCIKVWLSHGQAEATILFIICLRCMKKYLVAYGCCVASPFLFGLLNGVIQLSKFSTFFGKLYQGLIIPQTGWDCQTSFHSSAMHQKLCNGVWRLLHLSLHWFPCQF